MPVTREDFERIEKFNNVDEYVKYRNSKKEKPLSMKESKEYLNNRDMRDTNKGMRRAYNLLKRDEEMEKAQESWWKNF